MILLPTVQEKNLEVSSLFYLLKPYFFIEAKFVNPKIVTSVPGPGAHEPRDTYTTKEQSISKWSINRIDKNKRPKSVKQPGPTAYNLNSKIGKEMPEYGFGLRPFIDPQKCRTTTGPGFYDPQYIDGR